MQPIYCPNCAEVVPAEHINIQQMAAVCPACNTVFEFDIPEVKAKRRKVKKPEKLTLHDTDAQLEMIFRTNFRLERNEAFANGLVLSVMFTIITMVVINRLLAGEGAAIVALVPALITSLGYYWLALTAYNRTHIEMNAERIRVSRQPIPSLTEANEVDLYNVVDIHYEETAISKREGYDTPRFRVWAETEDGREKLIANDLIEDYAIFVTQQLNDRLQYEMGDADVSRLVENDTQPAAEDTLLPGKKGELGNT